MVDSIEILNDLDEVIRRTQQEVRERKQKKAEAESLANRGSDKSPERDENSDTESPTEPVNTEAHNSGDRMKLLNDLNEMIDRKQCEERGQTDEAIVGDKKERTGKSVVRDQKKSTGKSVVRDQEKSTVKSVVRGGNRGSTRAAINRANGANSRGPITPEGKQRASANSLKHGFFANVEKLNPEDAPIYKRMVHELRHTLLPDNPVEEMHIRELAMLSARLQRLEAAEYALLCSEIEAPTPSTPTAASKPNSKSDTAQPPTPEIDSRSMAAAFLNTQEQLAYLQRIEVHLRRAYNRTWDRFRSIQKERRRISPEESRKRTHHWQSEENERTSASSTGIPSPNPYDTARDFEEDFPGPPTIPPPNGPQNGPSPSDSDANPTPKEPTSN